MTFDKKKHQDKINQVEQYIRKHSADVKQHHWREHYHYRASWGGLTILMV